MLYVLHAFFSFNLIVDKCDDNTDKHIYAAVNKKKVAVELDEKQRDEDERSSSIHDEEDPEVNVHSM